MKKIETFLLVFVCLLLPAAGAFSGGKVKPVKCSVEVMPNYVWHLFALSDIHDRNRSPYGEMYGGTLPAADSAFLHGNRHLIAWGSSRTGKLTPLLFFLPFRSEIGLHDYLSLMELLQQAVRTSDYGALFARFDLQEHEKALIRQTSFTREELEAFEKIVSIVRRNYPVYERQVWPRVKPLLEQAGREIDAFFAGKDPIGLWERNLKREFAAAGFTPVLTYANAVDGLPSANNLTLERNNFGIVGADPSALEALRELIVHELGIFTIMPLIGNLFADPALATDFNKRHNLIYIALETFVEKRRNDTFGTGRKNFLRSKEFDWFYEYYASSDRADADPEQLIRRAIAVYGDRFGGS